MKRKLGLELYGPCSLTGAEPRPHDTIATINEFERITFHTMESLVKEGANMFVVTTTDGNKYLSSECYLLYTAEPISTLKSRVKKLMKLA